MQRLFGRVGPRADSPHELPDDAAAGPFVDRIGRLSVALTGRPRIGHQPFLRSTVARQILSSYEQNGEGFLALLRGPFAVVLIDAARDVTILAIDRMGIERLCWSHDVGGLVFGTSAADVAKARSKRPEVNRQALFDFMLSHMVAAPDTAYAGVNKLPPATYLRLHSGMTAVERYWTPDFTHVSSVDARALQFDLLPTLRRAVAACEPDEKTGSFLSGGLDSSTVTGVFAENRDGRAKAFSVGFGVEEYNELAYARLAAKRFGCEHFEYEVTPKDIVDHLPRIASAYDEPFGNSSVIPTFCCARFAATHGVEHLLAGDGGDEIFGGNERYVRHKVFELYRRLPRWLRSELLEPLAARLDPESSPLPVRKFSSYVRQASVPLPERFETWNLVYREGAAKIFHPDLLASIDTQRPLRAMRDVWEACPSDDILDRMLWYDWKYTLADNDLRKVSQACTVAGVRVSYPMLDEDLIDLSIKVPSNVKIRGSELRTFFKQAATGFLPREIITKRKHGFGLPFGIWLKGDRSLQDLVYGSLHALQLRGLFNSQFIERVAAEHHEGHASYYGYAIWDLVMLEQWLGQT